jgi:hypothetical protein
MIVSNMLFMMIYLSLAPFFPSISADFTPPGYGSTFQMLIRI